MLRSDEFGLHPIIPCDAPDYEINSSSIGALYILAGSSPNNIYCYYPSGWTISWQAYILKPFSRGANTNRAYLQRHCEVTYIQRYEYAIGLFECFVSWSPSNFAKVFFGIYPPSEYNKAGKFSEILRLTIVILNNYFSYTMGHGPHLSISF